MTERLARASSRRPWLVVGLWLTAIVTAFVLVAMFLAFEGEAEITRTTESKQADRILAEGFPQEVASGQEITEVVVVRTEDGGVEAAATRARVAALAGELREAGATRVVTYGEGPGAVSQAGDSTVPLVALGRDGEDDVEGVVEAVQRLDDEPGYGAAVTGGRTADADEDAASLEDLKGRALLRCATRAHRPAARLRRGRRGPRSAHARARVDRGSARSRGAPGAGIRPLRLHTEHADRDGPRSRDQLSPLTLSRYREERRQGREQHDAIATAGATAGRAVLFSGIAFVLAMLGLLLVPSTIFRSLAAGAILVGIVSVIAALTLLPAVLALLGDRVNALRIPYFGRAAEQAGKEGRIWGAIVDRVMRRPVVSIVLAGGFLLALAAPVLALGTGTSGAATLPDRFESKQGYLLLREEFPRESTEPVEIAIAGDVRGPAVERALAQLERGLERRPIFGEPVVEANAAGTVARVTVPIAENPDGEQAIAAVRELRRQRRPAHVRGCRGAGVRRRRHRRGARLPRHRGLRWCSCSCSGSASPCSRWRSARSSCPPPRSP